MSAMGGMGMSPGMGGNSGVRGGGMLPGGAKLPPPLPMHGAPGVAPHHGFTRSGLHVSPAMPPGAMMAGPSGMMRTYGGPPGSPGRGVGPGGGYVNAPGPPNAGMGGPQPGGPYGGPPVNVYGGAQAGGYAPPHEAYAMAAPLGETYGAPMGALGGGHDGTNPAALMAMPFHRVALDPSGVLHQERR